MINLRVKRNQLALMPCHLAVVDLSPRLDPINL